MLIVRLIANMYSGKFVYYTWTSSYTTNARHATRANATRSYGRNDLSSRWRRSTDPQRRCGCDVDWYVLTRRAGDGLPLGKDGRALLGRAGGLFFVVKST